MKARVIETDEIVELQEDMNSNYFMKDGSHYKGIELDFDFDKPSYWDKLLHQYAGMAMQGILNNNNLLTALCDENKGVPINKMVADNADFIATALVNRLKEKEKCKE